MASVARRMAVVMVALAAGACADIVGIEPWSPGGEQTTGGGGATTGVTATTSSGSISSTTQTSTSSGKGGDGTGGDGTTSTGTTGGAPSSGSSTASGVGGSDDHCGNQIPDGDETAVDCGGSICPPCQPGLTCLAAVDCSSTCCSNGLCCEGIGGCLISCSNACQDDLESDIDCGGGICAKCTIGLKCNGNGDCDSNMCLNGFCQ